MQKFRKKPVVIEAVQITGAMFDDSHPNPEHIIGLIYNPRHKNVTIPTLEGVMRGEVGDWIIKGVNGELYPCKNDIFQKTYEPVEEGKL